MHKIGRGIFHRLCGNIPFPLSLITQAQAGSSGDQVKVRVTKYKVGGGVAAGAVTGGNDDDDEGGMKVQELGEGDPQWQQIQEVVKEQLERAGIKAEGRPEHTNTHT